MGRALPLALLGSTSIDAGARFAFLKGAEGFKAVGAKDAKPLAHPGEINPQQVSDLFWCAARSNCQDGGETLVDTPIKRFLPASFHFLALLARQDYRLRAQMLILSDDASSCL